MRTLRIYAVFVVLMSVVFSCKKERSFEDPNGLPLTVKQWEFTEGGSSFGGPMDSAYIRTIGIANSLNLSGTSTDGKGEISLQILSTGPIVKGDYKNPQVLFQYLQNGSLIFQNSSSNDFTITITSIDSLSVTGTFSGLVTDTLGTQQSITNGKFTAALSGVAPTPVGKGTLTVWSKQLCSGTGSISISVGDSTGAITQALAAEPSCGAAGTATFNLPSGAYTVIAVCGTDSLFLDAAVLPDVCTTLEVDFSQLANQDYFPLSNVWTYGNTEDYDNDTLKISNAGTTVIGNETYTQFFNDETGETNYYRKSGGIYYQYLSSAFGQALTTPLDIIILKDNVPVNSSWESGPYEIDFTPSGVPTTVTVKLVSTITRLNYTQTLGTRSYRNLIEVTTELFQENNGVWEDTGSGYTTVFAKGVGIVYYQDLDAGIDYQIRNYNVSF